MASTSVRHYTILRPQSPLAELIDVPVFSCKERINKPSREIYEIASDRLRLRPQYCIFVGDGSSEELTGATDSGMLAILKRTNLKDAYDAHRPEVARWSGIAVSEITELPDVLSELLRTGR